jgi:starvation-inducible DNA-binding protein
MFFFVLVGSQPRYIAFIISLLPASIKESGVLTDPTEMFKLVLDYLKELLALEREVLNAASEAEDEGTVALVSDLISGHEKDVWMIAATLS